MEKNPSTYTVHQLAELAGVSVRTLHHYDQIGLLHAELRSPAGYRLYGAADLLRLQQILFFRELGMPLADIRAALSQPGFDPVAALRDHRQLLEKQVERYLVLLQTIDKTILKLTEESMTLTDAELYEGFTQEQIDRYQREVNEKYDPALVAESNRRVRKMSREQWTTVKAEGAEIERLLAEQVGKDPADAGVQKLVHRHRMHMENFYPVSAEIYRGLAQMYVEHPEFRAHYEDIHPGLAEFLSAAMEVYARTM